MITDEQNKPLKFLYREAVKKRTPNCQGFREEYVEVRFQRGLYYADTNRIGSRGTVPHIGIGKTIEEALVDFELQHPELRRVM